MRNVKTTKKNNMDTLSVPDALPVVESPRIPGLPLSHRSHSPGSPGSKSSLLSVPEDRQSKSEKESERSPRRPRSATHRTQNLEENKFYPRGRRVSLPSIFKPTPSAPNGDESPDADVPFNRARRMSMPCMLQSLARQGALERARQAEESEKMEKERKQHGEEEDGEKDKGLSGSDIHAFYKIWEKNGRKKERSKLRKHRKLPPLNRPADKQRETTDNETRPRVFSF